MDAVMEYFEFADRDAFDPEWKALSPKDKRHLREGIKTGRLSY